MNTNLSLEAARAQYRSIRSAALATGKLSAKDLDHAIECEVREITDGEDFEIFRGGKPGVYLHALDIVVSQLDRHAKYLADMRRTFAKTA